MRCRHVPLLLFALFFAPSLAWAGAQVCTVAVAMKPI